MESRLLFAQMSSSVIRYLDTQVNWLFDNKPQCKSPQGCPLWKVFVRSHTPPNVRVLVPSVIDRLDQHSDIHGA